MLSSKYIVDIIWNSRKRYCNKAIALVLLFIVLGNIATYISIKNGFYIPSWLMSSTQDKVIGVVGSVVTDGVYESGGIGGGNITGSCSYGSKNLPIYSVDITSRLANISDNTNSEVASTETSSTTLNTEGKYISISFDAAWGADDTIAILDTLDKYNIKTTFFMTGGWVESFPEMVKEIYSRGHDIGNHSMNHKNMSKLSIEEQKEEIMQVHDIILELTGYESFLFRPPYGDYDSTVITTIYGCNYYPIQWSVDSLDWKDYGVSSIINTVTKHSALDNGAIILLHNGATYTAEALDTLISTLLSQGYTIVPISELIIYENFHMDVNGTQIAD